MPLKPTEFYEEKSKQIRNDVERLLFEEEAWEVCKDSKDITISRIVSPKRRGHAFKSESYVEMGVDELSRRIHPCGPYRVQWDTILQQINMLENINQNVLIVRHCIKSQLMGLVSQRDCIDLCVFSQTPNCRSVVLESIECDKYPPDPDYVRTWSYPSGIYLFRTADPNVTKVISLVDADPNITGSSIVEMIMPTGLISESGYLLSLIAYWKYPSVLLNSASSVPEVSLLISHLLSSLLQPFSGIAALINKWPWGGPICQLYACLSIMFGSMMCWTVTLLAFDRFAIICPETGLGKYRNRVSYLYYCLGFFCVSSFWALVPLIGWASYSRTPVQIVCSIDWYREYMSFGYILYVIGWAAGCYLLPFFFTVKFYKEVSYGLRCPEEPINVNFMSKKKAAIVCGSVSTYVCFVPFLIVLLWPIFLGPEIIPKWVNILPPVASQTVGLVNLVFYIRLNPKLWNSIKRMLGFRYLENALDSSEPEFEDTVYRPTVQEAYMSRVLAPTHSTPV